MSEMRKDIAKLIGIDLFGMTVASNASVEYTVLSSTKEDGYTRQYIKYVSGSEQVPAYLLIPDKQGNNPAILIHHQHNREHHLGKSEACGLAGNPLQAFGPELVKKGFVVLAPV